MIDVKMPPPPEPASETAEPLKMVINEDEEIAPEEPEEPVVRNKVPDEDVFKEAPQIKKVKRQPSAKQLAHLKKMREKKEANRIAKEEWMEEQRSKQKKFIEQEERYSPDQGDQGKLTKIRKKKINNSSITFSENPAGQGGRQNEPINQEYEYENPEYQGQQYYEEPTAPPPAQREQVGMYQLSAEQIRDLQFSAINDYDTIRKQRKAEKEAQQAQAYLAQQKQQVFQQMRGSTKQQFNPNDPWATCFN